MNWIKRAINYLNETSQLRKEHGELAKSYGVHWEAAQIKEHNNGLRVINPREDRELAIGLPIVLAVSGITVGIFYLTGLI